MVDFRKLTKLFAINDEELAKLRKKIHDDFTLFPPAMDAIYCVAGTKDTGRFRGSMGAPLMLAAQIYDSHSLDILVLRGTTKHGYAGFKYAREELRRWGVPNARIVPVDLLPEDESKEELNTYTESKALVAYCKREGLSEIYVADASFHQMRAGTTIISNLDRTHPELWIVNKIAQPPSSDVPILHSQGVVADILPVLEIYELGRLFEYHDKGFLVSCAEVLEYYKKRDQVFGLA